MTDRQHIEALEKILKDRIAERRVMAAGYPEAEDPLAVVAKIAATQLEIEALERAIAHEQTFLPAPTATSVPMRF